MPTWHHRAVATSVRSIRYRSFEGEQLRLQLTLGRRVALLLPDPGPRRSWDETAVAGIVGVVDAAHDHYHALTGRLPEPGSNIDLRTTVAAVPSTCGAGCAYLGSRGIELLDPYWELLHDGVRQRDQFDHVVFYEMGRNFWFLQDQLAPPGDGADAVVTGFAVVNRFTAMDSAGVRGGPIDGRDFNEFRSAVEGLVDRYEADVSLTWATTLGCGDGVPGSELGATDLFASLILRLARDLGERIHREIWRHAAAQPRVAGWADAVDNLVVAASAAAGADLGAHFANRWRFPVSDRGRERARRCGDLWSAPG